MANHLSMALIDTLRTLHARGWSHRRIARELGIHRDTVARHLQALSAPTLAEPAPLGSDHPAADAKPAIAPPGSAPPPSQAKPAIAPLGSDPAADAVPNLAAVSTLVPVAAADPPRLHRHSDCLPFREHILAKLEQGLTAQRIYQDLTAEHGFAGSYYSVRRFVHRLEQANPLPFRRMECAPGEEAQVDFGQGAWILTENGQRRRPHVLRIVLSYSRKAYSEVILRQSTDEFLRCVENAFWAFGGVPQRLSLDNLRAAVTVADWYDPELNPKVRSFAEHYGVAFLPTRPYTPRHKGKVERGVDYVQENALKGRCFPGLSAQNAFLRHWEETVADTRVHGTTRQHVGKLFAEVERPALRPLPAERFPSFQEGHRNVHRDGHVEVARAYYSVPPEYVGRRVLVRWDGRLVRVHNDRLEVIAVHVQQQPGRFSTQREHIPEAKISAVERGPAWLLPRIGKLGPKASEWAQAVLEHRGAEGVRVLAGLLALAGRVGQASCVDQACATALAHGEYRLRTVRALAELRAAKARQEPLPLTSEHPLIRPLTDYQQVLDDRVAKES
jgi:transposase